MWTENNTEGFTQAELDIINAVFDRIKAGNDWLEESNLNDAITSEWIEGMTGDELYAAVTKRLGLARGSN